MKTKQKIIICAVIAVVCLSMVSHPVRPEAEAEEPQQVEAGTLVEYIESTEPEATPVAVHEPDDAEYIAKIIYGCALYRAETVQEAVAWCVLNRVDSPLYPDTIAEVATQAQQWQGYSENSPVVTALYDTAQSAIDAWHNGERRPIPQDCLWFVMTDDGIQLRTKFEQTSACNYWEVQG